MSQVCIGFDTSNYTTSAAWFDGQTGENQGKLLTVPEGALGLRQSEALFQHVKRLHQMTQALCAQSLPGGIAAVGASTRPREVEGSYMPCFLVGEGQAKTLAAVLGVPFYSCSHQQGHIAAAAWSAGRPGPAGPAPFGLAPVGRNYGAALCTAAGPHGSGPGNRGDIGYFGRTAGGPGGGGFRVTIPRWEGTGQAGWAVGLPGAFPS